MRDKPKTTERMLRSLNIRNAVLTLFGLLEQKSETEPPEDQKKTLEQAKSVLKIGLGLKH